MTDRKKLMIQGVRAAGQVLMNYWGDVGTVRQKESHSSVVTAADLASEKCLLRLIRGKFPQDGVIAEESGSNPGSSGKIWVVDPLDGTSNFAAGVPWFGVLVALLEGLTPIMAAAYLPVQDTLYLSERGQGVSRDGKPVRVTTETILRRVLCAHGLDSAADPRQTRRETALLGRLVNQVRNVRATNSLVDFCYTIDGRFGGCINHCAKIWDIAGAWLMLREAGGTLTDLQGRPIAFLLERESYDRTYSVVGASLALHAKLIRLIRAGPQRRWDTEKGK